MSTLMQASSQWATRPDEERFTSLPALFDACHVARLGSRASVTASRDLTAHAAVDGGLLISGAKGNQYPMSHYAFGQLAGLVKAPAGYLRTLHPSLVADNLNYGLKVARDVEDVGVLLTQTSRDVAQLRAVTGPQYGRVWNDDIVQGLMDTFGDGLTGPFRVPGEFGKHVDVTKANTTLYASDRDMFVFLADEERRIEMPNRRDGKPGSLARGFFVWNSEVGAASFGVKTFLFDYVCCNRIVWGAQQVKEIRLRHTKSAPHRWMEDVRPALLSYAESSQTSLVKGLEDARARRLDNVDTFLASRQFNASMIARIKDAHVADEGRPIETAWDAVTGITALARAIPYQADRIELEEKAGLIIDI